MKVAILAADMVSSAMHPKSFSSTVGKTSLIEYNIRILNLLNIDNKSIYVITRNDLHGSNYKILEQIDKFEINQVQIESEKKRSLVSLKKFLQLDIEDTLILNGDRYFEFNNIEKLILDKKTSACLYQMHNSFDRSDIELEDEGGYLKDAISNEYNFFVPWKGYYGAIYLTKKDLQLLKPDLIKNNKDISYIEAINSSKKINIKLLDAHSSFLDYKSTAFKSGDLKGGSFAGLEKQILVKKFADEDGSEKLINEINWLESLPESIRPRFPIVVDKNISKKNAWFSMPWYDLENLRKKIICGKFDEHMTVSFLENIFNFLWNDLYTLKHTEVPNNWISKVHFDRFWHRYKSTISYEPFNRIHQKKEIIINGKSFNNLETLYKKVQEIQERTGIFKPSHLSMTHGDLHFQNMLVAPDHKNFILADPRGDLSGSDIFYDMGKLFHSFNGKYDLIHTDIAQTKIISETDENIEININLGSDPLITTYNSIGKLIIDSLKNYPVSEDKNWILKSKFNEAMHFSSLMYFHMQYNSNENRALCLYIQAIRLLTDIIDEL